MSSVFQFYSGEDKTLKIRLNQKDCGNVKSFSIPLGSTVTLTLPASPTSLILPAIIDNYDLGEIHVDLSDVQTTQLISGDIKIVIQSGSITRIAKLASGIRKLK